MIGEAHPRLGGERFVAGTGRFVDDVRVPGMLHAAVLRSPHAHARLVSIDTKRARDLPGVHAVLTAADVPAAAIIPNRVPAPKGTDRYLQPAIARDVVRFVGEPVALVVADDPYIARDALDRIDVVYQPLAACASTTEALAAGAARLFQSTDSNNVATITMRVGDADQALAGAHLRLRERFTYPRQTAAALETRGLVVVPPDPRGGELHLIGSTKCIHINRTILAPIFGIPLGALRLTEVDVGGGFGVRGELYPEDILVPLAAMKLGRTVRWIESRRENLMAANHAREVEYDVDIGLDGDGHILAIRALIRADIGAYVRTAALVPAEFGAALLPGPYRVRNYACDLWSVVTNKTPAGTLRSPGRPECNFVRERLLDAGAARLGLDPAEIRRRNLVRADEMPYDCGTKSFGVTTVYDSGDFAAERALTAGASFEVKKLTYAGCAAAVVVDVDRDTGAVCLRRVVVGADVGRAVNPALVDAQLVGGVAFGIGNTLHENLEYDARGQLLSGTIMDYALPYAADVPPVDAFYQEVRATTNPLGLRGLGECGNPGLGGAIANAVCDALGVRDAAFTALPVTPERVLALRR